MNKSDECEEIKCRNCEELQADTLALRRVIRIECGRHCVACGGDVPNCVPALLEENVKLRDKILILEHRSGF